MMIDELKKVASVTNSARNSADSDGIYVQDDNNYVITFCHGMPDGSISLEINDAFIDVEPEEIRLVLSDLVHYNIPENNLLFITPCFPNAVRRRYSEELAKLNIYVVGNWEGETAWQLGYYTNNPDKFVIKLAEWGGFWS